MDIKCAYSKLVPTSQLVGNPKNTNKHPEQQIKLLAKIIGYQGWRHPIVVSNLSGYIVAGHGRLEAAKVLGCDEVPVSYQDFENAAQEMAFLEADNLVADLAEHDQVMMLDNIRELELDDDFDLELFGIPELEIPEIKMLDEESEDDVPTDVDTRCKFGDVWLLGEHRLMCGDSTSIDAVDKLMGGGRADITFTSPPYNNGKTTVNGNHYANDKDSKSEDDYFDFMCAFTNICIEYSDFVFHNNQLLGPNKRSLIRYQDHYIENIKDILVWNKSQCPPHINKGTFNSKWEYVFCLAKDGSNKMFPCSWQGKYSNVIETENNSANEYASTHKAGFPVAFPSWIIEKMDFAKSVYDPFGGTGTTLIACENLNRKCFMMELDPHYCDVILTRWEQYTSKTAERVID